MAASSDNPFSQADTALPIDQQSDIAVKPKTGLRRDAIFATLLVIIICLAAYSPFITRLRYASEDFEVLSSGSDYDQGLGWTAGLGGERPALFLALFELYRVFGSNPLPWHVSVLLFRMISAIAVLWALRTMWPQQRFAALMAALLFAVYPGFLEQPLAVMHFNYIASEALFSVSLALTVFAARSRSRSGFLCLTGLAMLSGLLSLLFTETFVGLEALRLLVIAVMMLQSDAAKSRAQTVISLVKRWLPYLIVTAGYLIWRVFLFPAIPRANVGVQLGIAFQHPLDALEWRVFNLARNFVDTTVAAWSAPAYTLYSTIDNSSVRLIALVGFLSVGSAILAFLYYRSLTHNRLLDDPQRTRQWVKAIFWIGLPSVLIALSPVILAGRRAVLLDPFDRYLSPAILPATLFSVSLVLLLARPRAAAAILIAWLGLSVGVQVLNGNIYAHQADDQSQLWWQLAWRVPQLQAGSALYLSAPLHPYPLEWPQADSPETDLRVSLLYNPKENQGIWAEVLTDDTAMQRVALSDIADDGASSRLKNALVVMRPENGSCLHVLDSTLNEVPLDATSILKSVLPLSKVALIRGNGTAVSPSVSIFGPEPGHSWCYYYEKADLARQMGNWQDVLKMADEAQRNGATPNEPSEWLPFAQAYVRDGDTEQANRIKGRLIAAFSSDAASKISGCSFFKEIEMPSAIDKDYKAFIDGINSSLGCQG